MENYKSAEFYIFTGDTDISGAALQGIETGKWTVWNDNTFVWYATPGKISQQLTRQASGLKPDILFMTGLYSWHYTLVPLMFCKADRKIISVRGMLHPGALDQKKWKKKIFLNLFKLLEYNHTAFFHATDDNEANYIRNLLGDAARIFVAGNFPTWIGKQLSVQKNADSLKLVTIGLISPMKNILRVLFALKEVTETVEYNIYGDIKDEDYWQQCRKAINALPANITVNYRQSLPPENIASVLSQHHVIILPSESENFGHAIFESLSAGRPVITSYHTPYRNLKEHTAGINVDPASPLDIQDAIRFFSYMGEDEYIRWSEGAMHFATEFFDKKRLVEEYDKMFLEG